jgi:hypothetical protein
LLYVPTGIVRSVAALLKTNVMVNGFFCVWLANQM